MTFKRRSWDALFMFNLCSTAQKMKFSIKDFFSKCDQIRRKLRISSHLLKKSLMENFIFCVVMCAWQLDIHVIFFKVSLLASNYLEHLNYWMAKNVGITPHNMLGFFFSNLNRHSILQLLFLKEDDQIINSTLCDMENNRWNLLPCLPSSTFVIILTPKIRSFFKFAWLRIWILRAI